MAVVRETRIVFGFQDVARVRLRCGRHDDFGMPACDAEVSIPLAGTTKPPSECPACGYHGGGSPTTTPVSASGR